jgi:formylglycine-generating enzyme
VSYLRLALRTVGLVAAIAAIGCSSSSENASEQVPCPNGKGAVMTRAKSSDGATFCIDSTETTWAQYQEFLDKYEAELGPQPGECNWNDKQYVPHDQSPTPVNPNSDPELPVVGVDWCDAFAYCNWAGKRLCGKIGGGGVAFDQQNDASQSQWYAACSAGGKAIYPYGNDYDGSKCNGVEYGTGSLIPASETSCEGGFPKLYNMSGNAWEWEDSCSDSTGATDNCWLRSGEWNNDKSFLRCDYEGFNWLRDFATPSISFRCCGP